MSCYKCKFCYVRVPIINFEFKFDEERYFCKRGKFNDWREDMVVTCMCRDFEEEDKD